MRAYATATSTTASYEVIRDAATPGIGNKPAKTTTLPYRDILTRLWLLDALFESLVALNLRVYAQAAEAEVRHLRTHRGDREGDFIITGTDAGVVAVEVKLSWNWAGRGKVLPDLRCEFTERCA